MTGHVRRNAPKLARRPIQGSVNHLHTHRPDRTTAADRIGWVATTRLGARQQAQKTQTSQNQYEFNRIFCCFLILPNNH